MSDYREQLVDQVIESGKYISNHADEIVDKADLKTGLSIWIRFDQNDIPTVEITQTHYMNEVLARMGVL